jgi:chemotaxis protein CheX
MKFAENELKQITEETWKIVLDAELLVAARVVAPAEISEPIAACAQIVGDWHLATVLYCPMAVAQGAAAVMFDKTPESATLDDIQDTMCELINIIAGNVKGVLSGSSFLSLPSVVKGSDFKLRFPRHVLLSEVSFESDGRPLLVRLLGEDRAGAQIDSADSSRSSQ